MKEILYSNIGSLKRYEKEAIEQLLQEEKILKEDIHPPGQEVRDLIWNREYNLAEQDWASMKKSLEECFGFRRIIAAGTRETEKGTEDICKVDCYPKIFEELVPDGDEYEFSTCKGHLYLTVFSTEENRKTSVELRNLTDAGIRYYERNHWRRSDKEMHMAIFARYSRLPHFSR